jgi:hypothetical protein
MLARHPRFHGNARGGLGGSPDGDVRGTRDASLKHLIVGGAAGNPQILRPGGV